MKTRFKKGDVVKLIDRAAIIGTFHDKQIKEISNPDFIVIGREPGNLLELRYYDPKIKEYIDYDYLVLAELLTMNKDFERYKKLKAFFEND